jgi:hypothetical protein
MRRGEIERFLEPLPPLPLGNPDGLKAAGANPQCLLNRVEPTDYLGTFILTQSI